MKKKIIISLVLIFVMIITSSAVSAGTEVSKYTGTSYTHSSSFDGSVRVDAIDVSLHQGTIDWNKVKADGIDFAIIGVGGRGYGESGRLYFDDNYKANIEGAKKAGISIGIYYFSQAKTEDEAVEEANHCLRLLGDYDIELPVFMDYEHASDASNPGRIKDLSKEQRTKNAKAFCQVIENAGYEPGFYSNLLFLRNSVDGKSLSSMYTIWAAQYNYECNYEHTYEIWQYSSKGSVSGISGNVDCNFWYIDKTPKATQSKSIAGSSIKVENMLYSGAKNYETSVQVTDNGKTLREGEDYKVAYIDNRNMGTAYAYVIGWGEYADHQIVPFKISESSGIDEAAGVESDIYSISDYVTGVSLETDTDTFKKNIKSIGEGYSYKLTDSSGSEITSGVLGTGDRFTVCDAAGKECGIAVIVVRGDSDGDGKCDVFDLIDMRKHLVGLTNFYGAYEKALDIDASNEIDIFDLIDIRAHIAGIKPIK